MKGVAKGQFVGEFLEAVTALINGGASAIDFLTFLKLAGRNA